MLVARALTATLIEWKRPYLWGPPYAFDILLYAAGATLIIWWRKVRLVAGDKWEIHLLIEKPSPLRPLEFDIPHEASEYGELDLAWWGEPGLGGSGRKYQVSEVWLIKK